LDDTKPEITSPGPRTIDRYEILGKLAEGGMAEIFLAKQSGMEGFEKVVVLKCILPSLIDDEEFITMFLDEARIAARLNHPNIAQIYDLGRTDETLYIAMEHVAGRNLQQILLKEYNQDQRVPIHHVCKILAGVCEGLHYAHEKTDLQGQSLNLVHRDVSPQNILVSYDGNVKLVDFGIAKASSQVGETRAGVLKGKYAYMSPEQVRGWALDGRSDLFSVGVVLYELLTGRRPFEQSLGVDTLRAIMAKKPVNPLKYNPEIPDAVMRILGRCLEKSPDKRYQSAQELQMDFEDYLVSSPEKSTSVRLARYMESLFDDELNQESGRLHVSGVGEVIIPAGQMDVGEEGEPAKDSTQRVKHLNGLGKESTQPTISVAHPMSELGDDELFSEVSATYESAGFSQSDLSEDQIETAGPSESHIPEEEDDDDEEGQERDTMTAFDAKAYQDYVAKVHEGGEEVDLPVFVSQEEAAILGFEEEPTDAEGVEELEELNQILPQDIQPPQQDDFDDDEETNLNINAAQTIDNQDLTVPEVAPQATAAQSMVGLTASSLGQKYISNRISSVVLVLLILVAGAIFVVIDQLAEQPFAGEQQEIHYSLVRLKTVPEGAKVFLDDKAQKKAAPVTLMLERGKTHRLRIEMDGFESHTQEVTAGENETPQVLEISLNPKK
tara:strand:- start:344 stop:2344 length:2001 start_codon:yes stop_codon:yes gene_type:complete